MKRDVKAVFLDAAGTLIRLAEPLGKTYARFASEYGLDHEPHLFESAFWATFKRMPERPPSPGGRAEDDRPWWLELVTGTFELLPNVKLNEKDFEDFFNRIYRHYAQPETWELFEEVEEVLVALQQKGIRLGIVSNFDTRLFRILDGLNISHRMERIIVSSRVGVEKPHPKIFKHALEAFNLQPHEVIHIGDDEEADLNGAVLVGIRALLVKRPEQDLKQLLKL